MIPTDLATRLKNLLDLPLPEVGRVSPARDVSPELTQGQRFTAQVTQPLPDGTFRALVAGRTLTLSLPKSVKNGDVLELVVTRTTPETVFARTLEPAAQQQPSATLSTTARLMSHLLTGREGSAPPTTLNAGAPLLQRPPQSGAELAPLLQRALAGSGMFYEAHQAQWVDGKFPMAQLLAEPQAQLSPVKQPSLQPPPETAASSSNVKTPEQAEQTAQSPNAKLATLTAQSEQAASGDQAARSSNSQNTERALLSQLVPRELAPLVLNQLDALATQQLTWQGQVWPGQTMQWSIEQPPDDAHGRGAEAEEAEWRSSLKVTLPSLGGVEARLYLTAAGIAIRFAAEDETTVARLSAALPSLGTSLESVGVPLTGAAVAHEALR
jgi:hypothetical protein